MYRLSVDPFLLPTYTFPLATVGTENLMPLPRVSRVAFCWLLYNSFRNLEGLVGVKHGSSSLGGLGVNDPHNAVRRTICRN